MAASRQISASDVVTGPGAGALRINDLFDPNDPGVVFGSFVNPTDGTLTANNTLNVTGFIPVVPGFTYVMVGAVAAQRRAYYDANKAFVSGVYDFNPAAFTIPAGAGITYMRLTVPLANWETLKIEQQSTAQLAYTAFLNRVLPDEANLFMLRQIHARLTRLAANENVQVGLCLAGDS